MRQLRFLASIALLALGAVSAGTVVLSEQIAERSALEEAERTATFLTDSDPAAPAALELG